MGLLLIPRNFYSNKTEKIQETNHIFIKHEDGTVALYVHLSPQGVLVNDGDHVMQGEIIGIAGNSGYTGYSPHLHFDVREAESKNCNLSGLNWSNESSINLSGCKTVQITFKNANPADIPLILGNEYEAQITISE